MKNFLKKAFSGVGIAFLMLAIAQPSLAAVPQAEATGGAALNADPRDFVVLAVSNYTRCPGSNGCWAPSISNVQPGEVIAFRIYAHNTGAQPAYNTRVRIAMNPSGSQLTARGTLSADNAPAVWDDIAVSFASGVQASGLTFVGGEYYANSSLDPNNPDPFPNGSSASQVAAGGINIGTLQNDYAGQFTKDVQIVVRYRVPSGSACSASPSLNVTPSSETVSVGGTAQYQAIYDSNGTCPGGETNVTGAASWFSDSPSVASSLGAGRFRGNAQGSTSVRASYNGLQDTAGITVTGGQHQQATLVVVPPTQTINVGGTATYRALYDADGPSGSQGEQDVTLYATWTSDSSSIGTSLGNGRFRGNAQGTTGIQARYSGITASATLRVIGDATCDGDATLRVTPRNETIEIDEIADYQATYDSNGSCAGGERDVTNLASWSVDSSSIASNLGSGRFRGNREGNTTVRASYNGLTDTASLRVEDDNNGGGSCDGDETLVIVPYQATFGVGQTYQYRALYDSDGPGCSDDEEDVTNSASWSGSSAIVTNLDDGRFRGNNGGTARIEARYSGITAEARANVIGTNVPPFVPQPPVVQPPVVLPPQVIPGGTIQLPPTVIGGGTVVQGPQFVGGITAGVATESVACITVTPSVDVTSMLPGQDFVYTTLYRNDCPFALNNAVLRVFIPNDVEFKASSNPFFLREGQKFSYNIGVLPPGGQGSVAISGMVRKDARIGDTETFTSTIEFLSATTGRIEGTTSYLVAVLGGDIRRTLSANLADTLGHIFGTAWLWFIIGLLILAGIIWFLVALIMRRRAQHVSTTKVTTVAPAEDPLRALRNA